MKRFIIDACSIILLAKASVLETFTNKCSICTSTFVYDEVLEGKKKLFADALLTERLKEEGKITIVSIDKSIVSRIADNYNMDNGEASIVAFGLKDKETIIITDNMQGRKAASVTNLPLVGSIEIIVSLCKKKSITKEKAYAALEILKEEGWFHSYLIDKAKEDIQ